MSRSNSRLRIFLSYGHDEYSQLAVRLKKDLGARDHEVWFDIDELQPGKDWEHYIESGFRWLSADMSCSRFLLLMTPHSVRRPNGFCLNEIAKALMMHIPIIPLMVVPCEPPLSICRLQWLDFTGL